MRYPFLLILLLITIVMASRGDAAPLQNHGIKLFQHRQHILVGGQEITVEYHSAKNTITQKRVVYSLRIADKFNRQLYKREYDIPFGVFSEEIYQNSVEVLPLVGDSGEGIAVFYSLGVGQDAIRKIDILGLRGKGPVLLGSKIELVPVVTQMPNHFLFPKTDKANIIKLSKGDRVLYRYWTGQMYIYFPVVIDWYGSLSIPSKSTEFRVEVPAFRKGGGRIMVHLKPTPKSSAAFLTVNPTANVVFLGVHCDPSISGQELGVRNLALRVEVNGKSGWILDQDSYAVLGLCP